MRTLEVTCSDLPRKRWAAPAMTPATDLDYSYKKSDLQSNMCFGRSLFTTGKSPRKSNSIVTPDAVDVSQIYHEADSGEVPRNQTWSRETRRHHPKQKVDQEQEQKQGQTAAQRSDEVMACYAQNV